MHATLGANPSTKYIYITKNICMDAMDQDGTNPTYYATYCGWATLMCMVSNILDDSSVKMSSMVCLAFDPQYAYF